MEAVALRDCASGDGSADSAASAASAAAPQPMDADKIDRMQQVVEHTVSPESRQHIMQLLSQINLLNGTEKLLLYLKLPTGAPTIDPLKQPINPLGSRAEIHQTVMWIQTHLEVDPDVSLPKQDVYNEYVQYCTSTRMKALSTADFGKVMKQVYPCVKPRRLGTRGNSRYCYAGMRKRIKLEVPQLPDLDEKPKNAETPVAQNHLLVATSQLIREWAEKMLGFKFTNLQSLAHHLIEKDFVNNSSNSALVLSNSNAILDESYEVVSNDKSDDDPKLQQRGVIKQLKRKIQSQPQSSQPKIVSAPKKSKLHDSPEGCSNTLYRQIETPGKEYPIKREKDPLTPEALCYVPRVDESIKDYTLRKSTEVLNADISPPQNYSSNQSRECSLIKAVNLAPTMNPRNYNSPVVMNCTKNSVYKCDNEHMAPSVTHQPTNLSRNTYVHYNSDPYHHQFPHSSSNVPINLSHTNTDHDNVPKLYKPPVFNKSNEFATPVCENDTLNLSTTNRRDNWPPVQTHHPPPPPTKLPLPGKKMILETYNNENQINAQSYYNNQAIKPSLVSPGKISDALNRGEYLPKKMRATETFGGKLAAARLLHNAVTNVPINDPDKYNKTPIAKVPGEFSQSSPASSQPEVPITNLNAEKNQSGDSAADSKINDSYRQVSNYMPSTNLAESSVEESAPKVDLDKINLKAYNVKRVPRVYNKRNPKDLNKNMPDKPATRGRPRKKSLTKAKYTRRQPKNNNGKFSTCDHTKYPKRSSDSCCSLTDTINIKTGIICREKHSEILNRERVSSICNMDKHALDDYLINESSSQENEEELMKYFQHNADSLSNDENVKEIAPENDDADVSKSKNKSSEASVEKKINEATLPVIMANASNVSDTSTQESDFLDSTIDAVDDHNQCKDAKLSQLRELLKKNFSINSSASVNSAPRSNISDDILKSTSDCNFPHNSNASESAFTSIAKKNNSTNMNVEYKEGSASASLAMLSKRQLCNPSERPISTLMDNAGLNARRRVSFDHHDQIASYSNHASPVYGSGQQSVPHSPTSRAQQFNFMPISPGPLSPVNSNKNSPNVSCKRVTSPTKLTGIRSICTSPIASPFVSPRNTPVPRARVGCQVKPVPSKLQMRKLNKLGANKSLQLNDKFQSSFCNQSLKTSQSEMGNFIIPNEQSTVPRSPNFNSKIRNYPMSAPPSPNILTPKYKPNFINQNNMGSQASCTSVIQILPVHSQYQTADSVRIAMMDRDQPQHVSNDPLAHEVSTFFSDSANSMEDTGNSIRSQSVPLHQNAAIQDGGLYFGHDQSNNSNANLNFMSYNNTPCNSIPATPVPREFCDFGNALNDTCESISKACLNSENLDKIYNVLDSTVSSSLVDSVVKQNDMMLNQVNGNNLTLPNFSQDVTNNNIIAPLLTGNVNINAMSKPMQYADYNESEPSVYLKRSNSVEMDNIVNESRFFISRSVPSTPLPCGKTTMPNFDLVRANLESRNHYRDEYSSTACRKLLSSKSVPSTPLLTDDRNVFSYSNRDFLINGNSVDQSISNAFGEKEITGGECLPHKFLNDGDTLKGDPSVLADLSSSPLQEIDMVNNELASFNDMDIASELPTFTAQGIAGENDYLGDLDMI